MSSKKSTASHVAANFKEIHARGLAADVGADEHEWDVTHGPRGPPPLPVLTAIELEQHVTLERAAEILNIHIDTFLATYPHLIRRVSPRCRRVKLRDLLSEQRVNAA
jgi:hypothetical protein